MEIVFNSVPVGLYRTTMSGRLIQANQTLARLLGYPSVEALLSVNVLDLWAHPADRNHLLNALNRDGATAKIETLLRRCDGSTVWADVFARRVDADPEPFLAGMIDDITARKQLELQATRTRDALHQSEALFRRVFDQLPVGAALVSGEGRFHRANAAFCNMLGWTEAELTTMTVSDVTHPEEREKSMTVVKDLAAGHIEQADVEKRYLRKDGTVVWGALSVRLVKDVNGRILWQMPVVIDVTERRRLEHQLQQAQKMEAIGQLAGGIAHDFNNILTAVLGYCDLALDRAGNDHSLAADIRQIQEGGNRAAALTRQLLAFSRKQVLRLEVADLNHVLERFRDLVRPMIGEDIDLTLDLSAEPALLQADVAQLQQVAMNLVVNARDAMPEGGSIRIRTANVTIEDTSAAGLNEAPMAPGPYVQLVVGDTGHGMTEETRQRVFEPFFTTKAPGKGTGLGLAVVYGIVRQMGGFIWVESAEGRGTTLTLYFPRAEQAGLSSAHSPADRHATRARDERILLVEDDRDVRTFAAKVLRRSGYVVTEAGTGREALEHLQRGPRVDLVVTDMVMPGMNGPELARQLTRLCPELPVLYTSGYLDHRFVSHEGLDKDVDLLEKPFSARTLLNRVRGALDRSTGAA